MYPVKDHIEGCVNPTLRNGRSCVDCYFSQVENGTWQGDKSCLETICIVLDIDKLPDTFEFKEKWRKEMIALGWY